MRVRTSGMSGQKSKSCLRNCLPTFVDVLIIFLPLSTDYEMHSTKRLQKCLSSTLLWIKIT